MTDVNLGLVSTNESKLWQRNAEDYIKNCKIFELHVDPNVVIALQTGWDKLQPSKRFGEGGLLPLMPILDMNNHIKKLNLASSSMHDARFRGAGNGNANARVLNHILKQNTSIDTLDISSTGLDDDGINEICEGLKSNQTITDLNISSNHFGTKGTEMLLGALMINQSVKKLDISGNALGFVSINSLLCSCRPKGMELITHGNYVFEEILNSVSHGIAFILSVVAANVLISDAATDVKFTDYHFWGCVIYSFSLCFLFLASCLFHSFFMLPKRKYYIKASFISEFLTLLI